MDNAEFKAELKIQFPHVNVVDEIIKAKDWILSSGAKKKDYKAFMRNWCRNSRNVMGNSPPRQGNYHSSNDMQERISYLITKQNGK